jgi:hypothetical protein
MARLNDEAEGERAIKVLWDRDRVVVRPVGNLDQDAIEAVLGLLACAREAGVTAVVDLDAVARGDVAGSDLARLMADTSLDPA